jgi:hypothetical protein
MLMTAVYAAVVGHYMLLSNHRLDAPAGTVAFLSYTELQTDTKSCMTFDFAISVSTFFFFYFTADI